MPVLPLSRGLVPLRRRLLALRRVHDGVLVAASAGTGAATGALVALTQGGDRAAAALSGALLVALPVLLVRGVERGLTPLDDLAVARVAESRAGWQERLSTALEHPEGGGSVGEALRADARDHLALLDAVRMAPWRWPVAPLAWLATAAVGLVLVAAWPVPGGRTGGATDAPGAAAAATLPANAVRALADQVAAEAARSDDTDLAALAAALRELADRGPTGDLDADGRDLLGALLDDLTRRTGTPLAAQDALERAVRGDAGAAEAPTGAPGLDPAVRAADGATPDYDDLFSRTDVWVDDEDPEPPGGPGATPASTEIVRPPLDPESRQGADFLPAAEGTAPSGGLAEIIGAADQSQAGESVLAGRGSQALDATASGADVATTEAEAVLLVGIERDEGRRIEVELPPPAEWASYDPAAFAVGAWRAGPEGAVSSDPPPLRYRQAAGRYFLPSHETAASP